MLALGLGVWLVTSPVMADYAPDSTGSKIGVIDDTGIIVADPGELPKNADADAKKAWEEKKKAADEYKAMADKEPLAVKLADVVGHNKVSINIVWTLITGFLVMFMQLGFALVETGMCRAKNAAHTMAMNFMIYPLGMLGFYVCGFAFMFGGVGGAAALGSGATGLDQMISFQLGDKTIDLLGFKGFFLGPSVYDVSIFTLFLFQMLFMDTTATIPTGTMAERWGFGAFVMYGMAVGTILYPVYGCWVWGGGWLADLGMNFGLGHGTMDFAGSSVVHLQGGLLALVGGWVLGPRHGKYNKDGSINPMPGHNVPFVIAGTLVLAFGWFGFNAGSTLAGSDLRIAVAAVNTMLASATAAMSCFFWLIAVRRVKPDPTMLCNGMLAGLVAITGPCAFTNSQWACFIGMVAGIIVVEAFYFIDRVIKIDDPVGAISVHGINGLWGTLALGLFADGTYGEGWNGVPGTVKGLLYGDSRQFVAQIVGCIACAAYVLPVGYLVFKVSDLVCGIRVPLSVELEGLDISEMGVAGYTGVVMDTASETPLPQDQLGTSVSSMHSPYPDPRKSAARALKPIVNSQQQEHADPNR